jgi:hypothetical protein
MEIQSVMFSKEKWTKSKAREWLRKNDMKAPKADDQKNFIRYTQRPKTHFKKGSFKTIELGKGKGIKAVVGCPKPGKESDKKKKKNPPLKVTIKHGKKENTCKAKNPSISIPSVLVTLGIAIELEYETPKGKVNKLKFPKRDKMLLVSCVKGKQLFILPEKKIQSSRKKFDATADRHSKQLEKGLAKYSDFKGFESLTGAIMEVSEAKFKKIGRAHSIVYESDKWSGQPAEYVHYFTSSPSVYQAGKAKPAAIAISGGKLSVKEEGIAG